MRAPTRAATTCSSRPASTIRRPRPASACSATSSPTWSSSGPAPRRGGQGAGLTVNRDPGLEAEADRAGEHAARGERAEVAGGTRGATAGADTIQGEFIEDVLTLVVFMFLDTLLRRVVDAVTAAHDARQRRLERQDEQELAQRAEEDRQAEDRYQRNEKASGAKVLVEVAARALEVAEAASKEAQQPALADAVGNAVEEARAAAAAAQEATDAASASVAYRAALAATGRAIALAAAAVAQAVRGHVQGATSHRKKVDHDVEHTGEAADAAGAAAKLAEEAAAVAQKHASAAATLAEQGMLAEAIVAAKDALAAAKQAGLHAKTVSTQADAAKQHAAQATKHADRVGEDTTATEKSPSAEALADQRVTFKRVAKGHAEDVLAEVEQARTEAPGKRDGAYKAAEAATPHVERAEGHRKQADQHYHEGASAAANADAGLVGVACAKIAEQQTAITAAGNAIKKLAQRAPKLPSLAEPRASVVLQGKCVDEILARFGVSPPTLDELPKLIEAAVQARATAEQAQATVQAEVCREEARLAVERANELAKTIQAQASEVTEASTAAHDTLDEARKAVTAAELALALATKLHEQALAALTRVVLTSADAIVAAKEAAQRFAEVNEQLVVAEARFKLAEQKAKAADTTARKAQSNSSDRGQVDKIQTERATVVDRAKQTKGLDGEVEVVDKLALDAKKSGEQIASGRDAASKVPAAAAKAIEPVKAARQDVTRLADAGERARSNKLDELRAAGKQASDGVFDDVGELGQQAQLTLFAVQSAAIRLKSVDGEPSVDAPSEGEAARRSAEQIHNKLQGDVVALKKQAANMRGALETIAHETDLVTVTMTVADIKAGAAQLAKHHERHGAQGRRRQRNAPALQLRRSHPGDLAGRRRGVRSRQRRRLQAGVAIRSRWDPGGAAQSMCSRVAGRSRTHTCQARDRHSLRGLCDHRTSAAH